MLSETVGLRTRPDWDQKIGLGVGLACTLWSWSWSWIFGVVLQNKFLLWCSPRDQDLGLEAPRGQNESLGLGLEHLVLVSVLDEKVLQFFKTFVVILDGSDQCTPWHFVRDNKSSLPFCGHCLREPSAFLAHQPQSKGYLATRTIC